MSWQPPLRPELRDAEPYGAPQLDVPVQLNTNENPYGPPEEVVADIAASVAEVAAGLNRYPDRDFAPLRAALADYLAAESGVRVGDDQIWAANGSNEVMLHLLQAFGGPGRVAMSFAPTYSMYPEYARDTHTGLIQGHLNEDFSFDMAHAEELIAEHRPSVVLLPSPNNPTGTALPHKVIGRLADLIGGGVLVLDEAYAEFRRRGTPSAVELLAEHPNLVVTRTMSKAFAAAGLRLGYLAADPRVRDALRVVRLPYHLSSSTQAIALACLRHAPALLAQVDALRAERDGLVAWLSTHGFEVADSDANFVLFGRFENRHALWTRLLDHGVLVREVGPEGWLRVSIGTPAEMEAFKTALEEVRP
jgi:histidinol-phosphate aminotransferase